MRPFSDNAAIIDRSDPDDVIIELQKIATMLFVAPDHGEAFWANGARTGFAGVGAWLAETSDEPLTMGAIYRHLTEGDARSFFKKELANQALNLSVSCRTALADFAGSSDNSFADIKKTITNVLGLWLNPLVDAATSTSDFDLRDLRKRPMSIYLGVSPDELDRIAPLYNLLFQQLIDLNVREAWLAADASDFDRTELAERLRRYTVRHKRRGADGTETHRVTAFATKLVPEDPLMRHRWLFADYYTGRRSRSSLGIWNHLISVL